MKSPYEIAWELLMRDSEYRKVSHEGLLANITGLNLSDILILKRKEEIIRFLSWMGDNQLVKLVLDEIEKGIPHWDIKGEAKRQQLDEFMEKYIND